MDYYYYYYYNYYLTDLEIEPDDVLRRVRVDGRQHASVLLLQLLKYTTTSYKQNTPNLSRLLILLAPLHNGWCMAESLETRSVVKL